MAKKKKTAKPKNTDFSSNPFSHLKGFAVSGEEKQDVTEGKNKQPKPDEEQPVSFADEMACLGVERMIPEEDAGQSIDPVDETGEQQTVLPDQSDDELFLQAMGQLEVEFRDQIPEEAKPPTASAQRMKQLKKGKLVPEKTLDLHGLARAEVAGKLRFFLENGIHHDLQTLLVITGRGLHSSGGEPVLRQEAEHFMQTEGQKWVAEWGRAPKQYGGDGALVLFLRSRPEPGK